METMTADTMAAFALAFSDPAMSDLVPEHWERTSEHAGDLIHKPSGWRIAITGPHGRWLVVDPRHRRLGRSYYKLPSTAAAKLLEACDR